MKLTTYLSDIFGVSGRALLEAVVSGEKLQEEEIRSKVKYTVKRKGPELIDALHGRLRLQHRKMMRRHLEHIDYLEKEIVTLEAEIEWLVAPYATEIALLDTIPGIDQEAAASTLAEVGQDMRHFPTNGHLAS